MGQAFDRTGALLGELEAASKREVFDKLMERHPDAHELRIKSLIQEDRMPPSVHSPLIEKLDELFTYHAPTPEQIPKYEAIRAAAKTFARVCVENSPPSADQTAGVRLIRQAVHIFNGAIALNGLS